MESWEAEPDPTTIVAVVLLVINGPATTEVGSFAICSHFAISGLSFLESA